MDVSVIVPMFHGNAFLEQITENIERNVQTSNRLIEIELILVNDSPEEPLDKSCISEVKFPVIVLTNAHNAGIQRSRLNGLNAAKGSYVLFLDQDDEIADDAIINLYRTIEKADMSVSDWRIEQLKGDSIITVDRYADVNNYTLNSLTIKGNVIGPPGHCLIKRTSIPEFWKKNILSINGADDYLLWLNMVLDGAAIAHCNRFLYTHKYQNSSCSNNETALLDSENEAFITAAGIYGFSTFRMHLHKRSIKYRRTISAYTGLGFKNRFMRKMYLLVYPERIAFELMNKLNTVCHHTHR